ncbi:hypothetical protein [Photobacterium angustum]|uniref:Molecular chaperone n=1 Tax=Photobacterium angustum TaxID=661 RepID=A0A855SA14_PHOAN|nr:hypothetical protein [Photobacterium angustum]KJF81555.1 hypothetical protein UB36_10930 [Photobacterium damselae subsp. damselae]KJG04071.1 hypothetical protein UB33_20925 [Photobacterium angustum]KJG16870.1 hypothetical protein UA33_12690 [Photobacterium angustum]KJG23111.1 hypothetical protein UA39_11890 [Photobacterium angustum]KJG30143.1 hypothetical protein UA36_12910 [Photobacterium angustum]
MNEFLKCGLFLSLLAPTVSQAIGINSMIEFAERGEGKFTINNNDGYRQFIHVAISSLDVENGKILKKPYTRDNIDQWDLTLRPAKTVIDSGLQKDFKVQYEPKNTDNKESDKYYQLTFAPTPYFSGKEKVKQVMQVAVGFASIFVVPAEKDQPLNYNVTYNQDHIQLKNNGDSYVRAYFNACEDTVKGEERKQCSKVVYALAGRDLRVSLPPEMTKQGKINAEFSTHYSTYEKTVTLTKGQTIRS